MEYESDVEEERGRVKTLLDNLRMRAEILVFWLASGELKTYTMILSGGIPVGDEGVEKTVNDVLRNEEWWQAVQKLQGRQEKTSASEELAEAQGLLHLTPNWPSSSFQEGRRDSPVERFQGLKRIIRSSKSQRPSRTLGKLGARFGMRTHRLHDDVVHRHACHASASEESESNESSSDIVGDGSSQRSKTLSPASKNDVDDFEEEPINNTPYAILASKIARRHSHGDLMPGPSPTKRSSSRQTTRQEPSSKTDNSVQHEILYPDPLPIAKI